VRELEILAVAKENGWKTVGEPSDKARALKKAVSFVEDTSIRKSL
jgi:hypothetical protein